MGREEDPGQKIPFAVVFSEVLLIFLIGLDTNFFMFISCITRDVFPECLMCGK